MIHVAGPLVDGVQRCTRCNEILTDYRGAMVPDADADKPLMGWADGAHVEVEGVFPKCSSITDAAPDCRRPRTFQ